MGPNGRGKGAPPRLGAFTRQPDRAHARIHTWRDIEHFLVGITPQPSTYTHTRLNVRLARKRQRKSARARINSTKAITIEGKGDINRAKSKPTSDLHYPECWFMTVHILARHYTGCLDSTCAPWAANTLSGQLV